MTFAQYYLWGMHLFWWLFWLVGFGVLMYLTWPGRRQARRDLSREALRRRFADGEITEDEYRHRLAVLEERQSASSAPGHAS